MRAHDITLELTETEAQLVTTACHMAVTEWAKGDTRARLAASILQAVELSLLNILDQRGDNHEHRSILRR